MNRSKIDYIIFKDKCFNNFDKASPVFFPLALHAQGARRLLREIENLGETRVIACMT
jgi:hypothetical protein